METPTMIDTKSIEVTTTPKIYTRNEVLEASIKYFNGDELAAEVWINKYCLKDSKGNLFEKTPDDMHKRLAKEFARIEKTYKNPLSEEEIYESLKDFKYVVPQGSPMAGIGNDRQITSISNCFVIGNEEVGDSYGGILKLDQELVQLQKRRAGVGIDLSFVRPKGTQVKNSALTSTGVVPFMQRYSNSTREVAQDGRRGALMESLHIRHINAEDFIDAKMTDGLVTGANISIRIDDAFMQSVQDGGKYIQQYPIESNNPKWTNEIDSRKLWAKIIHNAWKSAEPGILFWDTIIKESIPDCYIDEGFKTVSTNPCVVGDTLIAVADSRKAVKIKELAALGKDIYVYSTRIYDKYGTVRPKKEIKRGVNPRQSGTNVEVWKLTLTDGSSLIATPDHMILKSDGHYEELKNLESGTKINPYYKDQYVESVEFYGHDDVYNMTVDTNHNYDVVTKFNENNFIESSGITVKNCGEIPLCPNDSCRLLSVNLYSFVEHPFTPHARFDFNKFAHHANIAQRLMDDIIDLELEKIDIILDKIENDPESDELKATERTMWQNIRKKCIQGRRTGTGTTADGDMIAAMNLTYGTTEANEFIEKVHKFYKHKIYLASVNMAKERGAFPIWDYDKEKENPFLKRLFKESSSFEMDYKIYGRRNISLLTQAPAGTTSVMTQTSSGIESAFMIHYKRRRKINPNDKDARVDFTDDQGDTWQEYQVFHHKFEEWLKVHGYNVEDVKTWHSDDIDDLIAKSPYHMAVSKDVDWLKKVEMQGLIQKHVDHSISVTVNLPEDITEEMVAKVYETAWKSGCKGITVYREGSRSGVLISDTEKTKKLFIDNHAPKRPKKLDAEIVRFQNNHEKWIAFVGLFDDRPYEIFTGKLADSLDVPNYIETGHIIKRKNGGGLTVYDFVYEDKNGDQQIVEYLSREFNKEYWNYAKLVSSVLRHGMPIVFVHGLINSLKLDSDVLNTWKNGLARVIKKYIPNGTTSKTTKCDECGAEDTMEFIEGCETCKNCGHSACT